MFRFDRRELLPSVRPAEAPAKPTGCRPIRVLIVAARFLPDLGGTETHIHEVTQRLAKRGDLELTVLATDRSGARPACEELDGFTVLRCRAFPRRRDYYFAPSIYRYVRDGDYDVVHCQGIHNAVPVLAMMGARKSRVPYIVSLHTGGHSSYFRRRFRNIQWRALGPLLRGAAVIIAVSRFEQRAFERICSIDASRFRIIQNGGDLPESPLQTSAIPGRIVSSGRLEKYKGHHRLIEALPIVQQSIPHASLHILGSGPYEDHLRSLARARGVERSVTIEYVPPDDRARMAELLSTAAVVASMSDYEAHPVAFMEALTMGIPAVGLDATGIGDLVEDGLVMGVPKRASPTRLAQSLIHALEQQGLSKRSMLMLPTWDIAAAKLATTYMGAIRVAQLGASVT
jgi:glycosyltransferase involved in cell wall biosynthesis